MIGGVRLQQLVAEPPDLRLVGHVAGVPGDRDAGRSPGPGGGRDLRHGACVHVAGRDRAALGGELPHELAAHPRAAAGHYREHSPE